MYEMYKAEYINPVSIRYYREEFHRMKLSFKKPKQDTCHECDKYKLKIELTQNEEEKGEIIEKRDTHQKAADYRYIRKSQDSALAKVDTSVKCLTFDLQQCLPTPSLAFSVAFHKRQLWTFNLTIHDNATREATCYMWHESIADRGANQIASCLFKHLSALPPCIKKVILYSDTCGGQNKNSYGNQT